MNMLYEGLKRGNATIVIVPSTAVESMQLGGAPTMATIDRVGAPPSCIDSTAVEGTMTMVALPRLRPS